MWFFLLCFLSMCRCSIYGAINLTKCRGLFYNWKAFKEMVIIGGRGGRMDRRKYGTWRALFEGEDVDRR